MFIFKKIWLIFSDGFSVAKIGEQILFIYLFIVISGGKPPTKSKAHFEKNMTTLVVDISLLINCVHFCLIWLIFNGGFSDTKIGE